MSRVSPLDAKVDCILLYYCNKNFKSFNLFQKFQYKVPIQLFKGRKNPPLNNGRSFSYMMLKFGVVCRFNTII